MFFSTAYDVLIDILRDTKNKVSLCEILILDISQCNTFTFFFLTLGISGVLNV